VQEHQKKESEDGFDKKSILVDSLLGPTEQTIKLILPQRKKLYYADN